MVDYLDLLFIGMVYETIIIIVTGILLVLILKKYYEKKHKLTFLLFLIFLNWFLGIIFSWLSKVIELYSGIPWLEDSTTPEPGTIQSFFLLRISYFRISFLFVTIGILLTYILEVKLFEKGYTRKKYFAILFGIFTAIYVFFVYIRGFLLLDVLAFLFVAIYMLVIYLSFAIKTIQAFRAIKEKNYKKGFLSLSIMSICLILVFVMFLVDRILIFLGNIGFTIFYFMAWTFAVIAILCAYLGYIKPKSK